MERKRFLKILGAAPFLFNMKGLNDLYAYSRSLPAAERMPALFVGHGNPMNAIEENSFVKGFRQVAASIPRPVAIVCISAHWFTKGTKVTAMEQPKTIHDFGGFPRQLFEVLYPAPGSPALATETAQLLSGPTNVELDHAWGLDHGAWTVLKHFYPNADVPVIELSIDYTKPPQYHFELASRLAALRDKGVLIVGSGNIVHNLGLVDFQNIDKVDYGFDWAREARSFVNTHLLSGNFNPIINYDKQGQAMKLAAPTPDHYLPLIYTLGTMHKKEKLELFNDQLLAGSLSMTSVKIS